MRDALLGSTLSLAIVALPAAASESGDDAASARELLARADASYEAGEWSDCAETYARAADRAGRSARATAAYNAACCLALAGDADAALRELGRAIESGFRDRDLLLADDDLAALRSDSRWPETVAALEAAEAAYLASINVELRDLYREDQADRRPPEGEPIDWELVGPRDEARRRRVLEMITAGGLKAADDHYHAAMVLQHGHELSDFRTAHELCLAAVELDPEHGSARWLAAAALDRWLMNQDKPQKYGTQYRLVDGRWTLWEVDPATTDEERAEWNVPPLAEAQARAAEWSDDEAEEGDE